MSWISRFTNTEFNKLTVSDIALRQACSSLLSSSHLEQSKMMAKLSLDETALPEKSVGTLA